MIVMLLGFTCTVNGLLASTDRTQCAATKRISTLILQTVCASADGRKLARAQRLGSGWWGVLGGSNLGSRHGLAQHLQVT